MSSIGSVAVNGFGPANLSEILAPMPIPEFMGSHWCRSFCYLPGWLGKFSRLLTWNDLNDILTRSDFEKSRLSLVLSGLLVDSAVYSEARVLNNEIRTRILPAEFAGALRRGATAVLNDVNGLHRPLGDLAAALERHFGVPVGINAYAAYGGSHGFDVHRDDHEVFVLQIVGRKRWFIYENQVSLSAESRTPSHTWETVLEDGDLLYIPRGCWHAAVPLNEPCLHVTVSVSNPSVSDIVAWLAEKLRDDDFAHSRLSRLADTGERIEFVANLKETLVASLTSDVLDQYFADRDSARRTPPRLSLPWSATLDQLPEDGDARISIVGRRSPTIVPDSTGRILKLTIGDRAWSLPAALRTTVEALVQRGFMSIAQLTAVAEEAVGERMARAFVSTLIKEGIAFIVPPYVKDGSG